MAFTARQLLLEAIIKKAALGEPIAFNGTAPLRTAVDAAGFLRTIAADGKDQVATGQGMLLIGAAMEAAVVSSQPQLAHAIYLAERDRFISGYQNQSSSYTTAKNATDASATSITGTVLS